MPRISTIVPMFNGVAFLPTFFDSLAGALPEGSELILVDDGSTEPVWDTVPEIGPAETVVRLRNEHNLGYAVAVNRAFAIATGEVVIQLNTDLVLDPRCITAMLDLIEREPRAGVVGSKLVYPTTGLVQHVGMAFGNHTKPHVYRGLPATHPLCNVTREVQITTGATVAMTRRTLDLLGPLDSDYFNINDDIDHCLIARERGLRNFVCADSVAHHWESHSGPARFARLEAGEARFWSRWGGAHEVDLGRFFDEALDHALCETPALQAIPFEVLDLSRGADQPIALGSLGRRWAGLSSRVRHFRQTNHLADRVNLPLVLPHWIVSDPTPFIYLIDGYRELEENELWFANRRQIVDEELVVDLTGVVLRTSELVG